MKRDWWEGGFRRKHHSGRAALPGAPTPAPSLCRQGPFVQPQKPTLWVSPSCNNSLTGFCSDLTAPTPLRLPHTLSTIFSQSACCHGEEPTLQSHT